MKLNPAEYVIYAFGGVRKLARLIDRSPSAVCAWRVNRDQTKSKGTVPSQCHENILKAAKKLKIDVTASDLVLGRVVKKKAKKSVNGK